MIEEKNQVFKVGLVGCGRISEKHFSAIEKHEKLKLVSVCDEKKESLENVKKSFDVTTFTNIETMLLNSDLDILSICTPNGLHAAHAKLAADIGVHVLTEKPISTDLKSSIEMLKKCREKKVNLFVVLPLRYYKLTKYLKKCLIDRRFGK